ncbi:MAG: helix-turn-helix transcriptional regulator [Polyangia bacterium]
MRRRKVAARNIDINPLQRGSSSDARRAAVGLLLHERRAQAGLSRAVLAARAGVSQATLLALETGQRLPGRATLERILRVRELGLERGLITLLLRLAGGAAVPLPALSEDGGRALNWLVTPGYNGVQLVADHARFVRGGGGHVEQSGAYLDHHSAHAFLRTLHAPTEAARHRDGFPLAAVAEGLRAVGASPLHLVALGPGDGALEVALVQALLRAGAQPDLELCLLELSQPLLSVAYQRAAVVFGTSGERGAYAFAVQGSFHALPAYPLYHRFAGERRRRVFLLLGLTLGSLDDERRLLGDGLAAVSERGDCLLVDCVLAPAGVPVAAVALRHGDPLLADGLHPLQREWLAGPLRRADEDAEVELALRLELARQRGGYALDAVATVRSPGRAERRFVVFRFRRHAAGALATTMAQSGWRLVSSWERALQGALRSAIFLFQRR